MKIIIKENDNYCSGFRQNLKYSPLDNFDFRIIFALLLRFLCWIIWDVLLIRCVNQPSLSCFTL